MRALDMNGLLKRAMRNRTISEAFRWLNENYTGSNTRKAIRFQMDSTPQDLHTTMKVYWHLHDAIQLGYGKDTDFTRVYR